MGIGASASPGLDRGRIRELAERERAALDGRTRGSEAMLRRAERVLPGGVASSYHLREPWPVYLARGEGARVWDVDGNEYLDFHNGFSAMVQGHAHQAIGAALAERYPLGTHFGAPSEDAVVVAEELARRFGLGCWRFTNSGTESTMAAIRIARASTGRDDVLKILGAYHGHHDTVLVHGATSQAGIPRSTADHVHAVPFNDAKAMDRRIAELDREGCRPACVIMEAALTNVGLVLPEPGYLEAVRELTRRHRIVLIFDEVKTGLTIAAGGATERFGVRPDMVTLAKAVGGGLPAGAIGMTAELARPVEDGRVKQAGTFNGNPLGMAAARANLFEVLDPAAYERLERLGERIAAGCRAVVAERRLPARCVALGHRGCLRLDDPELAELAWLWSMNRGLFATPGREPEWTLSVAHTESSADRYVEVFAGLAAALT